MTTIDPRSLSALIIDDSAHISALLRIYLKRSGFTKIEYAANGRIGLDKVAAGHPDIVFLDGIMPEMDGLTALREIKKIAPQTIVVVTTSLSTREIVLQFKDAGADLYMLKPFDEAKFEEIITRAYGIYEKHSH